MDVAKLDRVDVDVWSRGRCVVAGALGLVADDDREEDHGERGERVARVLVLGATDEERHADQRGDRPQDCDRTRCP